jgi:hypothetical protein
MAALLGHLAEPPDIRAEVSMAFLPAQGSAVASRSWAVTFALAFLAGCGGGSSTPTSGGGQSPQATPTPPAGTARLIAMSVPPGSTLIAQPMGTAGQQVPELWTTVGVTMNRDVVQGGVEVFLRTPAARCLGVGRFHLDFPANTETVVTTFNVSNADTGPPTVCPLPYTTSQIEILVFASTGEQLLSVEFPASYSFVAP